MNLNFFKNFAASGGETLARNVTTALVQMAPETASAAELKTMEDDLDHVGELISRLTRDQAAAQAEYDRESKIHTQMLGAAEHMQAEIATLQAGINDPTTDATKKAQATSLLASKQTSLDKLLAQLEEETRKLDDDKKELDAATTALQETTVAYQEKSKGLVAAKGELAQARNDVERAEIEKQRAAQRAETQRQLSGLSTGSGNNIRVATAALKETAQKSRDAAANADRKATALKEAREQTTDDPNIAAAMAAAAATPASSASVADRLAAMRR